MKHFKYCLLLTVIVALLFWPQVVVYAADPTVTIQFTVSFDPVDGANGYAVYARKKDTGADWIKCNSEPFELYETDGKQRIMVTSTVAVPAGMYSYYEVTATAIGGPNNTLELAKAVPVGMLVDVRAPIAPVNLKIEGAVTLKL